MYYAWQQDWIVVSIPPELVNNKHNKSGKKQVSLFYFKEKWTRETTELLWSERETQNAHQLIQATLSLLSEAGMAKKVTVERVLSGHTDQYLLIFFDQSPLPKNTSIYTKLMIIESILKTLRENNITTPSVYFLANNHPIPDAHLDFSVTWPINGFAKV
jgi:hypothetical protein